MPQNNMGAFADFYMLIQMLSATIIAVVTTDEKLQRIERRKSRQHWLSNTDTCWQKDKHWQYTYPIKYVHICLTHKRYFYE